MEIVNEIPEKAPLINLEGGKEESLFFHPVIYVIQREINDINKQYEYYKKTIEEAKDERLLALVSAMSMEEALDSFLRQYIQKYKHIAENRDFSLSMKIDLAQSLCLIPKHILGAADIVRKIRNDFAHNLNINSFDSIDKSDKDTLKSKFKEIFPNDTRNGITTKNMFISVAEAVIIGLGIYASHAKGAKDYIFSDDFRQELNKRIKDKAT